MEALNIAYMPRRIAGYIIALIPHVQLIYAHLRYIFISPVIQRDRASTKSELYKAYHNQQLARNPPFMQEN